MQNLVRKNILRVNHYVPGKPIEEVKREFKLSDVIKLASNENCFGASPKALAAIRKSLKDINRYPDASSFYLEGHILGRRETVLESKLHLNDCGDVWSHVRRGGKSRYP